MTKNWKDLTPDQQAAVSRAFSAREAVRLYSPHEPGGPAAGTARPTAHELVLYLRGQGKLTGDVLLPLLRRDAVLKRKFEWLLAGHARLSVSSAAAAASSGAEFERPLIDGGWLRIVPSNANPEQAHLVIKLPPYLRDKAPCRLFARLDEHIYRVVLPPPLEGKVMLLMTVEDPCVAALRDVRSKLDFV